MSERKRYSPEYKRGLVELVRRSQSNCRQIALEVGVNPNMRTRRVREADASGGKLLRTVFLADYFVNATFRRELLRVLNRGEAVNALKRAIYAGRVAGYQAKRDDEMQAVADALSLLANILMAWSTTKMQAVLDHWGTRRSTAVPPELIGRIAPTRTEGINLRGLFRFPIDDYAARLVAVIRGTEINRQRALTPLPFRRNTPCPQRTGTAIGSMTWRGDPQTLAGNMGPHYRHFWHHNQADPVIGRPVPRRDRCDGARRRANRPRAA